MEVEVNGMPRHVADIRHVPNAPELGAGTDDIVVAPEPAGVEVCDPGGDSEDERRTPRRPMTARAAT